MDSELSLSYENLSIDSNSIATSSKPTSTRGRSAHSTWSHTRPAQEGEPEKDKNQSILYCAYCPMSKTYNSIITTNFRRHLKAKHGIKVESESASQSEILAKFHELYDHAKAQGSTTEIDMEIFEKVLDQEIINEAFVTLVVVQNLPYRIAEWPEFHTFCMTLNPKAYEYLSRAHSSVPKLIEKSFSSAQDIVRKKLQSALSNIHLSLDIWTSPNRLLLLGICAHFTDRSYEKLRKALIALRPVTNHSGEEQFATLLPILQEYGIVQKIGIVIGDNSSTNDTLCRAVSNYLNTKEGIQWDPVSRRLRCIGHIINLVVQAFLFKDLIDEDTLESYDKIESQGSESPEQIKTQRQKFRLLGPLGKLHNIVIHARSSGGRTSQFKELAGRMIPLDNRTRWNS
jgi:hypothetical protein